MSDRSRRWGRAIALAIGLIVATSASSTVWVVVHMVREQREALPYAVLALLGATIAAVCYLALLGRPRSAAAVVVSLLSLGALAVQLYRTAVHPAPGIGVANLFLVPTGAGALIAGAVLLRALWPEPRTTAARRRTGPVTGTLLAVPVAGLLWVALGVYELHLRTDWVQDWYGYRVDQSALPLPAPGPAAAIAAGSIVVGAALVAALGSRRLPPLAPMLAGAVLLAGAAWSMSDAIRTDHPPMFADLVHADPGAAMRRLALELPGGGEALVLGVAVLVLAVLRWYQSGSPLRAPATVPSRPVPWSRWFQDDDLDKYENAYADEDETPIRSGSG